MYLWNHKTVVYFETGFQHNLPCIMLIFLHNDLSELMHVILGQINACA